jgi:hypothetical protein
MYTYCTSTYYWHFVSATGRHNTSNVDVGNISELHLKACGWCTNYGLKVADWFRSGLRCSSSQLWKHDRRFKLLPVSNIPKFKSTGHYENWKYALSTQKRVSYATVVMSQWCGQSNYRCKWTLSTTGREFCPAKCFMHRPVKTLHAETSMCLSLPYFPTSKREAMLVSLNTIYTTWFTMLQEFT